MMRSYNKQSGFGLIEVIVALFILGLVVSALAPIMQSNVWGVENTLSRNTARFKAEKILDSLQVMGIHAVVADSNFNCTEADIDKRNYTCTVTPTTLEVYDGVDVVKQVKVDVSYDIVGTTKTLSVEGIVQ